MDKERLQTQFKKIFHCEEDGLVFFAPGRVNLIGEHTDYNGGHVFPCALTLGTYAVTRKTKGSTLRLYSSNFVEVGRVEAEVTQISYDQAHDWANYPLGIIKTLKDEGYDINTGIDILFYGDLPNGAGLSSSASIELVTGVALKHLFSLEIEMIALVKLCQKSENQFNGLQCGIMDQFASGMSKKGYATLLNTETLSYQYVPLDLKDVSIIIANTNKRRDLAGSKYNERRSECIRALKGIQTKMDIQSLGDLSKEMFEKTCSFIDNPTDRKRARHAVYENQRTMEAVTALAQGNRMLFGELMNASHISLRDDYEVSCFELDTLVNAAWENGAIGSRMTGAGFGGCTVSLVPTKEVSSFICNVGREYEDKMGYKAAFYKVSSGDCARQL